MAGGTLKTLTYLSFLLVVQTGLGSSASGATEDAQQLLASRIPQSIVSIHASRLDPNYLRPWSTHYLRHAYGSGVILQDGNILTNAHVVTNVKHIEVRPHGQSTWQTAEVLYISHLLDLALLTVSGVDYAKDGLGLVIGELPSRYDEVSVLGFPAGGNALSITKGVVSRIEHTSYAHSGAYLLAGQVDAAINPGNSGGPVIVDNKIAGIVMQGIDELENTGYFVPSPLVKHFLDDMKDGTISGIPFLNLDVQSTRNHAVRSKYNIPNSHEGQLIYKVDGDTADHLAVGDIVLSVEGHIIDHDGNVEFRPGERTDWGYYVDQKQLGETLSIDVLRDNKIQQLRIPLTESAKDLFLVPFWDYDQMPRYLIYNGFVFSLLTDTLMNTRYPKDGEKDAPARLQKYALEEKSKERQEIVILLYVLPHPVNEGYHHLDMRIIEKVNGVTISNFRQFYDFLNETHDSLLLLKTEGEKQIFINTAEAQRTHSEILASYEIEHGDSIHFRKKTE